MLSDAGLRWDYFGNVHERDDNMGSSLYRRASFIPRGKSGALPASLAQLMTLSARQNDRPGAAALRLLVTALGLATDSAIGSSSVKATACFWNGYENGPWSNPSPVTTRRSTSRSTSIQPAAPPQPIPSLGSLDCANLQVSPIGRSFLRMHLPNRQPFTD